MIMLSKFLYDVASRAHPNTPAGIPDPPLATSPGAPPPITVHRLDFTALGLPEYASRYAIVIDNLFSEKDCKRLLDAAQKSSQWETALVNAGGGRQVHDSFYRKSGRIMYDDQSLADWILLHIRPYLQDIETIPLSNSHKRYLSTPGKTSPPMQAEMSRLNERLRFLQYGPGQYFKPHYDGVYVTPSHEEVSYYTLHMYLNGDAQTLKGGATRFWTSKNPNRGNKRGKAIGKDERAYIDVESRMGRVLVFEHDGLLHSGEEVKEGTKISLRTDFMYVVAPKEEQMDEDDD
jgi:hypothetical protein